MHLRQLVHAHVAAQQLADHIALPCCAGLHMRLWQARLRVLGLAVLVLLGPSRLQSPLRLAASLQLRPLPAGGVLHLLRSAARAYCPLNRQRRARKAAACKLPGGLMGASRQGLPLLAGLGAQVVLAADARRPLCKVHAARVVGAARAAQQRGVQRQRLPQRPQLRGRLSDCCMRGHALPGLPPDLLRKGALVPGCCRAARVLRQVS
jgi:hypothetical protein